MLAAIIVAAAVVAGITGAWSPCGFSMVETLAPQGYAGRRRTTAIACTTFAAGALAGGVITFGGLALIGAHLGAQAPFVAATVALIAALGEARGTRIVPQVRRQVPESWRRKLPVPLAAGLYGVLLGLGFTTFILSFAVWALAGIAIALGDPQIGLLIGLGFGAGRALPVIALAPSGGGRLHAAMAERPQVLRSLRAIDAVALITTAAALAVTPAQAAVKVIAPGYADVSLDGALFAFHHPGATGELRGPAGRNRCPGTIRRSAVAASPGSKARPSSSRASPRSPPPAPTRWRSRPTGSHGAPAPRCTRRRSTRPRASSRARSSAATSASRC